jgi:hypothetical protein
MRRLQKEGSPVRAFLNTNDENYEEENEIEDSKPFLLQEINPVYISVLKSPTDGSSIEAGEPIPDQIQVSTMFEKPPIANPNTIQESSNLTSNMVS